MAPQSGREVRDEARRRYLYDAEFHYRTDLAVGLATEVEGIPDPEGWRAPATVAAGIAGVVHDLDLTALNPGPRPADNTGMTDTTQPTVIDFRDLRPTGRPGDRREGPRRTEERMLHLAEQVLLSTACLTSDRLLADDCSDEDAAEAFLALSKAVEAYRACSDRVFPSPSVANDRRQS